MRARALRHRYGRAARTKGEPTGTNLWALADEVRKQGPVLRKFEATAVPHLKRCIAAGLLESTGEKIGRGFAWQLTPKGAEAIKAYEGRTGGGMMRSLNPLSDAVERSHQAHRFDAEARDYGRPDWTAPYARAEEAHRLAADAWRAVADPGQAARAAAGIVEHEAAQRRYAAMLGRAG